MLPAISQRNIKRVSVLIVNRKKKVNCRNTFPVTTMERY